MWAFFKRFSLQDVIRCRTRVRAIAVQPVTEIIVDRNLIY